jgi:hypothetical protein
MSDLPPWDCRNARDAQAMVKWVIGQIDRVETISERFKHYAETVFESDERYVTEQAIEQADKGNIEPLRRLFPPELARFLHLPKLKRGKRFPKHGKNDRVGKAVADVKLIRALWMTHYGKKNRPKNDLVTAVQIAADRWKVDANTVANRMNKAAK